jgi:hypothetical protein
MEDFIVNNDNFNIEITDNLHAPQPFEFDTFERKEIKSIDIDDWLFEASAALVASYGKQTPVAKLAQLWDDPLQQYSAMTSRLSELQKKEQGLQTHLQTMIETSEKERASEMMKIRVANLNSTKESCDILVDATIFYVNILREIESKHRSNLTSYRNCSKELNDIHTKLKTSNILVPRQWKESIEHVMDEEYKRYSRQVKQMISIPEEVLFKKFEKKIPAIPSADISALYDICKIRFDIVSLKAQQKMIEQLLNSQDLLFFNENSE